MTAMPTHGDDPALARAAKLAAMAQALLVLAGLRHHLVWGGSLHALFAAFETACLLGFAWLGGLAWWRGMARVRVASPGPARLLRLSLPALAVAVLVPSFLSADVVDYVLRGRVLALHHANPYLQVAADFPADPMLGFGDAGWKAFPLPYGPVVAEVQGAVAWLAHQLPGLSPRAELIAAVLLFKLLFAGGLLLAAGAVRDIAALLRPGQQDVAYVAVLWSPLLLNECVAQAHNEALMLVPLLLAVRWLLAARIAAGTLALGVAVLAKLVPAAIGPLWLVWCLRQRRLAAFGLGAVAVLLLTAGLALQFFRDPAALAFLDRQSAVTGASFVWAASSLGLVELTTAQALGRAAVLLAAAIAAVRLWRRPQPIVMVQGAAVTLAVAACSLGIFGPWYHVWWAPLALACGERDFLARFARAVTWTAPLGYVVYTASRHLVAPHQVTMLGMAIVVPFGFALVRPERLDP